jgi:hypothetical protein
MQPQNRHLAAIKKWTFSLARVLLALAAKEQQQQQ